MYDCRTSTTQQPLPPARCPSTIERAAAAPHHMVFSNPFAGSSRQLVDVTEGLRGFVVEPDVVTESADSPLGGPRPAGRGLYQLPILCHYLVAPPSSFLIG